VNASEKVIVRCPWLGGHLLLLYTKGRQLTVVPCGLMYSVAVPLCSTCDLKVVLRNPGPCTRHGDSCAWLEALRGWS
jgi:hypothetical protein